MAAGFEEQVDVFVKLSKLDVWCTTQSHFQDTHQPQALALRKSLLEPDSEFNQKTADCLQHVQARHSRLQEMQGSIQLLYPQRTGLDASDATAFTRTLGELALTEQTFGAFDSHPNIGATLTDLSKALEEVTSLNRTVEAGLANMARGPFNKLVSEPAASSDTKAARVKALKAFDQLVRKDKADTLEALRARTALQLRLCEELGRACEARRKQEVDFVSLMSEIYEMQLMYHRTALQHLEAIRPKMSELAGLREQTASKVAEQAAGLTQLTDSLRNMLTDLDAHEKVRKYEKKRHRPVQSPEARIKLGAFLERALATNGNLVCADCAAPKPMHCIVNIGTLVCDACAAVHLDLIKAAAEAVSMLRRLCEAITAQDRNAYTLAIRALQQRFPPLGDASGVLVIAHLDADLQATIQLALSQQQFRPSDIAPAVKACRRFCFEIRNLKTIDENPVDQADLLMLAGIGNLRANSILEHGLTSQRVRAVRPTAISAAPERELFIRSKYLTHDFVGQSFDELLSLVEAAKVGDLTALLYHLVVHPGLLIAEEGEAAAFEAARAGHMLAVDFCVRNGAATSAPRHPSGDTPLHAAAANGHANCVRVLLHHQADRSVSNLAGELPMDRCADPASDALALLMGEGTLDFVHCDVQALAAVGGEGKLVIAQRPLPVLPAAPIVAPRASKAPPARKPRVPQPRAAPSVPAPKPPAKLAKRAQRPARPGTDGAPAGKPPPPPPGVRPARKGGAGPPAGAPPPPPTNGARRVVGRAAPPPPAGVSARPVVAKPALQRPKPVGQAAGPAPTRRAPQPKPQVPLAPAMSELALALQAKQAVKAAGASPPKGPGPALPIKRPPRPTPDALVRDPGPPPKPAPAVPGVAAPAPDKPAPMIPPRLPEPPAEVAAADEAVGGLPLPPPPAPEELEPLRQSEPPRLERAVALYDFVADKDEELSLALGDMIDVHHKESDGWWRGLNTRSGQDGFFPESYVKTIPASEA